MPDPRPEPAAIRVTTRREALPSYPTLPVHQALAHRFGKDQVCLLESDAGPDRDRKYQGVGCGELLSLSVRESAGSVGGAPSLCEARLGRPARARRRTAALARSRATALSPHRNAARRLPRRRP